MSDRFKFRVWDKVNKVWIESSLIDPRNGCVAGFYMSNETMEKKITLEQCTGLKDKNGKLIYEGDIVNTPQGLYVIAVDSFGLWTAIYKNNPALGVAEWSDIVKEYLFNEKNKQVEIIGNIHEDEEQKNDLG